MLDLDKIYDTFFGLQAASAFAIVLAALAGLLLALTPTVLVTVPAVIGYVAGEPGLRRWKAFSRSLAFVLGTATTFGAYGLVFGLAGRRLAPLFGENGFLVAGVVMVLLGLAMLAKYRFKPLKAALATPDRKVQSFLGAYLLGLPFGLVGSACPCAIPVVLAMLMYAGTIGSPWFGAALLFVFALVRGLPVLLAGTFTGLLKDVKVFTRWQSRLETASGVLLVVSGTAFVGQKFGTDAAVVAAGLAALGVVGWLIATKRRTRPDPETGPKEEGALLVDTEISTPGMVCEGCADTLTTALMALQAVHKVVPDVKQKRIQVFYNPERMTEDRLRERVAEMGFS